MSNQNTNNNNSGSSSDSSSSDYALSVSYAEHEADVSITSKFLQCMPCFEFRRFCMRDDQVMYDVSRGLFIRASVVL